MRGSDGHSTLRMPWTARGLPAIRPEQICEARDRQLGVEALGCCEPAHGLAPDCDREEHALDRSVEVIQAHQNADDETGCEHREGNDCLT
jgi:hypothetical protein